jgi:hypothetical protein
MDPILASKYAFADRAEVLPSEINLFHVAHLAPARLHALYLAVQHDRGLSASRTDAESTTNV